MTDAPESTSNVRGSVVGARLAFAASTWGESAREEIISLFDEADQKRLRSVAIDGDWFDYGIVDQIDKRLSELGSGDPNIPIQVGTFAAEAVFKRTKSQLGSHEPDILVERLGRACQQLQDFAQCEVKQIGVADENRGSAFEFKYSILVNPFYCRTRMAFIAHTIELLGLRIISADERVCAGGPERIHRYEIWWSPVMLVEESDEPDEKTRQLYRQAVTAENPGHSTRKRQDHRRSWLRVNRQMILGTLLLGLFFGWAATDGRSWFVDVSSPPEEVHEELQSRLFTCSGKFEIQVISDTSGITLRNKEEVLQAQIILEQGGRSYIKMFERIEPNGSMGIPLSDFRDDLGRTPNRHAPPTRIRVLSLGGIREAETSCTPIEKKEGEN